MKNPDELKNETKKYITKHRALVLYLRGGFPKQAMNPRGQGGERQSCRRLKGAGFNPSSTFLAK